MRTVREEMMYDKGETREQRKRRESRWKSRGRTACVETVWARENGRCQNPSCRIECVKPKDAYALNAVNIGHVHEEPPRSLGGDPTNPDHCVLVCQGCHDRLHYRRKPWLKVVVLDPDLGTRGELDWVDVKPQKSGKTLAEVFAEEDAREGGR